MPRRLVRALLPSPPIFLHPDPVSGATDVNSLQFDFLPHPAYGPAMGDVHKFKRPPRNQQQFRGYQPQPRDNDGRAKPARRLWRGWQKNVIAWSALLLVATGIWALGKLFAMA